MAAGPLQQDDWDETWTRQRGTAVRRKGFLVYRHGTFTLSGSVYTNKIRTKKKNKNNDKTNTKPIRFLMSSTTRSEILSRVMMIDKNNNICTVYVTYKQMCQSSKLTYILGNWQIIYPRIIIYIETYCICGHCIE